MDMYLRVTFLCAKDTTVVLVPQFIVCRLNRFESKFWAIPEESDHGPSNLEAADVKHCRFVRKERLL